ncbi:MAG: zf-HC2 domain-containing protein [Acidobacteria bacterium]|nr:zf-HC2 domain-containing protein [Acidobacteriota bacterium]
MHPGQQAISDLVDGALASDRHAEVERHLGSCVACRTLADELRAIHRAARALPAVEPPPDGWSRLEAAIEGPADGAEIHAPWWRLNRTQRAWLGIAAAVLFAAGVIVRLGPLAPVPAPPSAADAGAGSIETLESELRQAEEHYTKAISGLEQIASEGEGTLDPETAANLQKSLAVVDQAIDESRAAVRAEPGSEVAQTSLLDNFATKIALLQDTVALINEMRKGNDAEAAQIVSGLK